MDMIARDLTVQELCRRNVNATRELAMMIGYKKLYEDLLYSLYSIVDRFDIPSKESPELSLESHIQGLHNKIEWLEGKIKPNKIGCE